MKITKYSGYRKLLGDVLEGRVSGSTNILLRLIKVFKDYFLEYKWRKNYIKYIDEVSEEVVQHRPTSPLIYNFVERFRKKCRDLSSSMESDAVSDALVKWLDIFSRNARKSVSDIAEIFSGRVGEGQKILTYGYSSTVFHALVKVGVEKNAKVIVPETRPDFSGRKLGIELVKRGVNVTLTIDSAINTLIRDIDLVALGAEAVSSYGGVINKTGSAIVALVAKENRKRVHILAGTYKYAPQTLWGRMIKIVEKDPSIILSPEYNNLIGHISVYVPSYEEISPSYLDAIVTEKGIVPPKAFIIVISEEYPELLKPTGGEYEL